MIGQMMVNSFDDDGELNKIIWLQQKDIISTTPELYCSPKDCRENINEEN